MRKDDHHDDAACKTDVQTLTQYRQRLPRIVDKIIENCDEDTCYTHVDYEPIPSRAAVIDIIKRLRGVLFPGYFRIEKLDPINMGYTMGQSVSQLFDLLSEQICLSIRHDCFRYDHACTDCSDQGHELALTFLESIPQLRLVLATDVTAAYEGDPAAKSLDEIIFSYPGIFALMVYRVAHRLHSLEVPLLPRIMTEYAHSVTGIDIHPAATIGQGFVIDHGTGVVIGETTQVGKNVRIYQGVTLGALSLPRDAGKKMRGTKRHPTIEDGVIIYAGATILGGDTVIGTHSIVGGNVWITSSVPANTKVVLNDPELKYLSSEL